MRYVKHYMLGLVTKCKSLPGYDQLSETFVIERAYRGSINRIEEALFSRLSSSGPSTLNAAWWWNPVENGDVLYDWHVFLELFTHVDRLLSRHTWLAEWKAVTPGRRLELHAFGREPAEPAEELAKYALPLWREAGLSGEPQYEVLARVDNWTWLRIYLNDRDPRLLVAYSIGLSPPYQHWLDGLEVAFHPKCTPGTPTARYATIKPSGERQIHEYRRCAP